jgi:hypothetical protein
MRGSIGAAVVAAMLAIATSASASSTTAPPPVATPSPGSDARPAESPQKNTAARKHHVRGPRRSPYVPQVYGGPDYERPYYYRPYYYRPYDALVIMPLYGFGFDFGW